MLYAHLCVFYLSLPNFHPVIVGLTAVVSVMELPVVVTMLLLALPTPRAWF